MTTSADDTIIFSFVDDDGESVTYKVGTRPLVRRGMTDDTITADLWYPASRQPDTLAARVYAYAAFAALIVVAGTATIGAIGVLWVDRAWRRVRGGS